MYLLTLEYVSNKTKIKTANVVFNDLFKALRGSSRIGSNESFI